jgi:hypothetical protein
MDYFTDAKELIKYTRGCYEKIKTSYQESLESKEIKKELLIEIKNFMENLRSALDYTACGLFQKYGSKNTKKNKVYFPYAKKEFSFSDFQSGKFIDKNIPGLLNNRPDIVKKIESYQCFSGLENEWLPLFMNLTNENKHQNLTPQTRKEYKELNISSGKARLTLSSNANIVLGRNATMRIGDSGVIPGGQTISTNSPARAFGSIKQNITTWVSFVFQSNGEEVLPLLEKSLNGIDKIVSELSIM